MQARLAAHLLSKHACPVPLPVHTHHGPDPTLLTIVVWWQVDEDAQTVRVAAGITQRRVLDYLAAYTHWKEPAGWVLPAPAWFQDQARLWEL